MGEGQRLPARAVWALGKNLAHALSQMHVRLDEEGNAAPELHLRVGPDFVWIGENGQASLLCAKEHPEAVQMPGFEAPEQMREGQKLSQRTDTYRLGRLLTYLLAGDFKGLDIEAVRVLEASLIADSKRRRLTCEEFEQWCSHFDPNGEGERDLAALLLEYKLPIPLNLPPAPEPVSEPEAPPKSQELKIASNRLAIQAPARISRKASLLIAIATAALVYGAGLHWANRLLFRYRASPAKSPVHAIPAP